MNLPTGPLRRAILLVGVSGLTMSAVSTVALATRPASSSGPEPQAIQLVEPAADEETTTAAPAPVIIVEKQRDDSVAIRAEEAADRAETAAGRAEVAATKVETVATATTTTTVAPSSATVTSGKPVLGGTIVPVEETSTTTTIAAPKQWVVVARFPVVGRQASTDPPLSTDVVLETGRLRVTGFPSGSIVHGGGRNAIWVGHDCRIDYNKPLGLGMYLETECPTGAVTIEAGTHTPTGYVAPFGSMANPENEIVVEEYR